MKPDGIKRSLNIIETELSNILDKTSAINVLRRAQQEVDDSYRLYETWTRRTDRTKPVVQEGWGFSIRDRPLRFKNTDVSGYPFQIDLTCELRWKDQLQKEPAKGNIAVRLWALSNRMIYRKGLDADPLEDLNQRVMMRFHFDRANQQQSGPKSHLQIGGVADEEEYCWLHEKIEKPRFAHMPMDLVLVCELIGATFYEPSFRTIRTSGQWKSIVRESQNNLLRDYFDGCLRAVENDQSVLVDFLWQGN